MLMKKQMSALTLRTQKYLQYQLAVKCVTNATPITSV